MNNIPPFETSPRTARAPVERVVFVCKECARKFPDRKFRKRLKAAMKTRRWGRARLMETECFDLCPERRQVVATPELMAFSRLMVVAPGTAPEAVLDALFPEPPEGGEGSASHEQGPA